MVNDYLPMIQCVLMDKVCQIHGLPKYPLKEGQVARDKRKLAETISNKIVNEMVDKAQSKAISKKIVNEIVDKAQNKAISKKKKQKQKDIFQKINTVLSHMGETLSSSKDDKAQKNRTAPSKKVIESLAIIPVLKVIGFPTMRPMEPKTGIKMDYVTVMVTYLP